MNILSILILFLLSINISAQWIKTNGPFESRVRAIHYSGNRLFAGTYNNVYVSSNNGEKWEISINNKISDDIRFRCFASQDSLVFAGSAFDGLYRSLNNGKTWNKALTGWINSIVIDSNEIYVAGDFGVKLSTDKGINWSDLNNGLLYNYVFSLAKSGDTLYAGILNSIFKSTDKGKNWILSFKNTELNSFVVNDIKFFENKIFASTSNGVYISTDNGKSWNPSNTGFHEAAEVLSLKSFDSSIFAATLMGIYVSKDGGISWSQNNTGLPLSNSWNIVSAGSELYTALANGGVFKSTDGGSNWVAANNGIQKHYLELTSILKDQTRIFVGTESSGVFVSSDGGNNWNNLSKGLFPGERITSIGKNNTGLFLGTFDRILYSSNSGDNWTPARKDHPNISKIAILPNEKNIIVASLTGPGKIFISPVNSTEWKHVYSEEKINCLYTDGRNFFVGHSNGLSISTDNGLSWKTTDSLNTTPKDISSIAICGNNILATSNRKAYLSTNYGKEWTQYHHEQNTVNIDYLITNCSKMFGIDRVKKYYVSPRFGDSWSVLESKEIVASYENTVNAVIIDQDTLYAATNSGVWICPINQMIVNIGSNFSLPSTFSLSQNYPNPFNPETTISYSIPKSEHVTLKVFDLLGREVETLVNEYKQPGNYKATFNAGHLERSREMTSGIYFYRLQAGSYYETKKLILLK